MTIKVNEGTQTTVNTLTVGGTETQVIRLDVGSGTTASEFGGTIAEVTSAANLAKGTVTNVENLDAGTVTNVENLDAGTLSILTAGTIDTVGLVHADKFATVVSSGTTTLGTIKPLVSGSAIYVTDLIISAGSETDVEIGDGGTSTPIVGTMHFADNGGAVMNFRTPIQTSAGSDLVYKQSADVPLTITAIGYVN